MQVKVSLSEQVRRAALAQGRELPAAATVAVDLGALPEGLRAAAAPHLPLDDGEHLKVWRPCVYGIWVSPVDPADVVALLGAWLTDRLAGEEKRAANAAEMAANAERDREERRARARADAERILADPTEFNGRRPILVPDDAGDDLAALIDRAAKALTKRWADADERSRLAEAKRLADAKAAAEAQEADKAAWIAAHGSDHLRAAFAAGYDCQRLYVTERAAAEFPGFQVDFSDRSRWDRRSCPSEEGLGISLATKGSRVVWLTAPVRKVDDEDEWEPREAVVVEDFLGRYDLVREVA